MGRLTEYIFLANNPKTTKERFFWLYFELEKFRISIAKKTQNKETKLKTKDIFE